MFVIKKNFCIQIRDRGRSAFQLLITLKVISTPCAEQSALSTLPLFQTPILLQDSWTKMMKWLQIGLLVRRSSPRTSRVIASFPVHSSWIRIIRFRSLGSLRRSLKGGGLISLLVAVKRSRFWPLHRLSEISFLTFSNCRPSEIRNMAASDRTFSLTFTLIICKHLNCLNSRKVQNRKDAFNLATISFSVKF